MNRLRRPSITARQAEVLRFVKACTAAWDCAPTRSEIAEAFNLSRPTVEQHLQALAKAGMVKLVTRWRGITITARGRACA